MIWFFLAGWIAGAVGTMMFSKWWIHRHAVVVHISEEDEMLRGWTEKKKEDEENRE